MNLADLEAFVAVAETGSLSRAALRLRLTQPATTRRVQNLEAALGGAPLLDRSAKPPRLTPAGRQALAYGRRVLAAVRDLKDNAAGDGPPAGELRVGLAHGLGELALASPLDKLRTRFPGLQLRVSCGWTAPLVAELREGSLDCAAVLLTGAPVLPPEITAAVLGPEPVVVVAARAAKLPHGSRGVSLRDLGAQPWIVNTVGCGYREALQRALDRIGVNLRIAGEVIGYDLQLSLVARGAGLGLVPQRRLACSPERRGLRIVPVADFTLDVTAAMLRRAALGNLRGAVDLLQASIAARLRPLREKRAGPRRTP